MIRRLKTSESSNQSSIRWIWLGFKCRRGFSVHEIYLLYNIYFLNNPVIIKQKQYIHARELNYLVNFTRLILLVSRHDPQHSARPFMHRQRRWRRWIDKTSRRQRFSRKPISRGSSGSFQQTRAARHLLKMPREHGILSRFDRNGNGPRGNGSSRLDSRGWMTLIDGCVDVGLSSQSYRSRSFSNASPSSKKSKLLVVIVASLPPRSLVTLSSSRARIHTHTEVFFKKLLFFTLQLWSMYICVTISWIITHV